ncbi:MAG: VCBS repeat-containing protein, partial [Okeania sp. SIO3I5]|uniref:FG-GAP repeat domain-containing protein n=1 Tax=Okeania sp. SIO3I5 TaxID=2607805 RepID=UPI0013B83184
KLAYREFGFRKGGWSSQDKYPRQVADVNGDNRADIVGFANDGVYVSLGKTDGTFASHKLAYSQTFTFGKGGWSSQNKYPRQVADVNGDSRADIVGFANNGVYTANG